MYVSTSGEYWRKAQLNFGLLLRKQLCRRIWVMLMLEPVAERWLLRAEAAAAASARPISAILKL